MYTCAFPNELSSLPKARTLTRGSHTRAPSACTRINMLEQGTRESKANRASGTWRESDARNTLYYPLAYSARYPRTEKDCSMKKKKFVQKIQSIGSANIHKTALERRH